MPFDWFVRSRRADRRPQRFEPGPPVRQVAIMGADFPGLRPVPLVAQGDAVVRGAPVLADRADRRIVFAAPCAGHVAEVRMGPRRTLAALVIARAENEEDGSDAAPSPTGDLRAALLDAGLWPALRTRPFGQIPHPEARPDAILVTATVTDPQSPDPRFVVSAEDETLARGLEALTRLTDGEVHLCQPPGAPLASAVERVRVHHFACSWPEGLAGHHVARLCPVSRERQVWTIGLQDALAIGDLVATGRARQERVVAVAGPGPEARLVRAPLGASLRDLTREVQVPGRPVRVLSGDGIAGREAAFLGRFHQQVTLAPALRDPPGRRHGTGAAPIIPRTSLGRALPSGSPAVPLMRALSLGDAEAAERLGCLDLIEEDVAMLSRACTSGADYGHLLRRVLNELAAA